MDRVTLTRRGDGVVADHGAVGWLVDAEREWVVEGPAEMVEGACAELGNVAQRLSDTVALLSFGNAVGRFSAGPLGVIVVRSGKWTDEHYAAMLSDVATCAASLPFQAGAASALPYARSELDAPDVLYHVFVWLRHAVLDRTDAPLVGALHAILADPHRHMVTDERLVPAEQVSRVSARALEDVAAGRHPFRRVPAGRGLGGGTLFPSEMSEQIARPSADTAENRFVKAFLESCGFVVEAMRQRVRSSGVAFAHRVWSDCAAIEGELAPVQRHRFWEGVGRMTTFPAASTVLQRRAAYREVLRHHILMRMASKALPLDADEVAQLLEVKDIARLYELWVAFALIDAVRAFKGPPTSASRVGDDALSASLGSGLVAYWADGVAIAYNASFTQNKGFHGRSWSLTLRPDVSLWVPSGPSRGLHLFDGKFRLAGSLDDNSDGATTRTDDLHKMHTYRDAIREAASAWVLYPGTVARYWAEGVPGTEVAGVGAIPLVPGEAHDALHALVGRVLGLPVSGSLQGVV